MPSRKPMSSVIDASRDDVPERGLHTDEVADPGQADLNTDKTVEGGLSASEALALAEQAEAEAAEAEAVAAAARARAQALRLRRQADEAAKRSAAESESDESDESDATDESAVDVVVEADDTGEHADENSDTSPEQPVTKPVAMKKRRPRGARVWKWVAAGVAAVITVGLLAVSGVMMYQHKQLQDDQRRAAEFAAAARQGVVTLMSLDHTRAKEDVQRIIDSSTGDFKADFEATADDFAKVAEQAKVTTEAQVTATAVNSMTDDSAVVLVAATSTISNAAGADQDPRNWRLSVTVQRDGDQIKLAKVEFVP